MISDEIKFLYFSYQTLQVPRVARQNMILLCEGASQLGADSEVVSYMVKMSPYEPAHPPFEKLYGITAPITNTTYSFYRVDINSKGFLLAFQRFFAYSIHSLRYIFSTNTQHFRYTIVSSRSYSILAMLALVKRIFKRKLIVLADIHSIPTSRYSSWIHRKVDGNVCISQSLADDLQRKLNLSADEIRVAHSEVKIDRFNSIIESKKEIRLRLALPVKNNVVCYAGKVYYRYEEIVYLLQAAEKLNDETVIVIVGGRPDQVQLWEKERRERNIKNVVFRSFVPPSEIPQYLKAADLLAMYYSPNPLNEYRSPGKLFEYLASGTPVIAGRTRSIEEIITDGKTGFLVEPYQPHLLAEKIQQVLLDKKLLAYVGLNARKRAQDFAWPHRARMFLEYAHDIDKRFS